MRNFHGKMALALLVSAPLLAQAAPAGKCGDDFNGKSLGAQWTFLDKDGEPGGSAVVSGGKLALTGKGSDVYGDVNEFVGVALAPEAGNFDVSVKIESQDNTFEWAQAGILAANDVNDLSKGGYAVVDVTPGNNYNAFYDSAGTVGTLDSHINAGVSGYPVWIRLARRGKKFSAWYKNQADASWKVIAEGFSTQGMGPRSQLALVSLSHNDNLANKTVFDDFTCNGPAPMSGKGPSGHKRVPPGFDAAGRHHAR
ncbi:MAG: hypothetical protein JF616_11565 [Fibrobacteres bacterium]|jgi:hypothetical protein|nr:hypothetical protein [Fibrobacterota bacterium]